MTFTMSTLYFQRGDKGGDCNQNQQPFEGTGKWLGFRALRPQAVPREEHRQIDHDAHSGGSDGGERRGELDIVAGRFHQRAATALYLYQPFDSLSVKPNNDCGAACRDPTRLG